MPGPSAAASNRQFGSGLTLAAVGAIAFSGKAIIVKLAYRHGVDAVTLIMYRMLFALPMFLLLAWWAGRGKPRLSARDWRVASALGFCGYYLASFLDFAGLRYVTASLERLVLYLNPTLVLLLSVLIYRRRVTLRQVSAMAVSYVGIALVFGHEMTLDQTRHRPGRRAGVRQRGELCAVPGDQRRGGAAPRFVAPDRPGVVGGLRAVHRAVSAVAPVVGGRRGAAGGLAVAAQRGGVHGGADA